MILNMPRNFCFITLILWYMSLIILFKWFILDKSTTSVKNQGRIQMKTAPSYRLTTFSSNISLLEIFCILFYYLKSFSCFFPHIFISLSISWIDKLVRKLVSVLVLTKQFLKDKKCDCFLYCYLIIVRLRSNQRKAYGLIFIRAPLIYTIKK